MILTKTSHFFPMGNFRFRASSLHKTKMLFSLFLWLTHFIFVHKFTQIISIHTVQLFKQIFEALENWEFLWIQFGTQVMNYRNFLLI